MVEGIEAELLALIEDAALAGERALTNDLYAARLRCCRSVVKQALWRLRRRGLIQAQVNGQNQRRFYAARLGLWTKPTHRSYRTAAERAKTARNCLCCGASFPSEGKHNRLCEDCKRRDGPPWAAPARGFWSGERGARP